jgi:transposase
VASFVKCLDHKQFLASKAGRGVWVEALPASAPDLNPVEWAWQHLKHVELRNVTCLVDRRR